MRSNAMTCVMILIPGKVSIFVKLGIYQNRSEDLITRIGTNSWTKSVNSAKIWNASYLIHATSIRQ